MTFMREEQSSDLMTKMLSYVLPHRNNYKYNTTLLHQTIQKALLGSNLYLVTRD